MIFQETFLTNDGAALLTRANGSAGKIVWGGANLYTQNTNALSESDLRALTSLDGNITGENAGRVVSTIIDANSHVCTLHCEITNQNVQVEQTAQALGIFAKIEGDANFVLAIIARTGDATPTIINPRSVGALTVFVAIGVQIDNNTAASIVLDASGYAPATALASTNSVVEKMEQKTQRIFDHLFEALSYAREGEVFAVKPNAEGTSLEFNEFAASMIPDGIYDIRQTRIVACGFGYILAEVEYGFMEETGDPMGDPMMGGTAMPKMPKLATQRSVFKLSKILNNDFTPELTYSLVRDDWLQVDRIAMDFVEFNGELYVMERSTDMQPMSSNPSLAQYVYTFIPIKGGTPIVITHGNVLYLKWTPCGLMAIGSSNISEAYSTINSLGVDKITSIANGVFAFRKGNWMGGFVLKDTVNTACEVIQRAYERFSLWGGTLDGLCAVWAEDKGDPYAGSSAGGTTLTGGNNGSLTLFNVKEDGDDDYAYLGYMTFSKPLRILPFANRLIFLTENYSDNCIVEYIYNNQFLTYSNTISVGGSFAFTDCFGVCAPRTSWQKPTRINFKTLDVMPTPIPFERPTNNTLLNDDYLGYCFNMVKDFTVGKFELKAPAGDFTKMYCAGGKIYPYFTS